MGALGRAWYAPTLTWDSHRVRALAERAALVTGGSSGIGLAIARALGEDGYGLTVSARRPDKLEQAVEGLRADGIEAEAKPANMAEEEQGVALAGRHKER